MQTSNELTKADRVNSDPLAKTIVSMVDAMRTDYGDKFTRTFADKEQLTQLKRRLYEKLKGLDVADIMDGYDMVITEKKSFVPTVPEIVAATLHCQKMRKKSEKEITHFESVALLPPGHKTEKSAAIENMVKIKAMLDNAFSNKSESAEQKKTRLERLSEKLQEHEYVLKNDFRNYGKQVIDMDHTCSVSFCDKLGKFTSGVSGAQHWFCNEHYFKNK